jgi:microcystin-dependent protein
MQRWLMLCSLAALLAVWATAATAADEPLLGEVMIFAGNYAPKGWLPCDGRLLPINQNQALYSIIGTRFGGNGQTNFALPDLRGREAVGSGRAADGGEYQLAQTGGSATIRYTDFGVAPVAVRAATTSDTAVVHLPVPDAQAPVPADNLSPYLCIGYYIATAGIYPSRN